MYEMVVTVTSNGPDHPSDVEVVNNLSENLQVDERRSSSFCASAGTTRTCSIGSPGGNFGIQELPIYIWVTPTTAGAVTNTATVSSSSTDPIPANNTSTLTATAVVPAAPKVTGYGFSKPAFQAASTGGSIQAARVRRRVGTTVRYRLSEPATVTFTVERAATGRRVRGKCRKPTRRNRQRRRCERFRKLRGGFTHAGGAGRNSFKFTGRLRRRKLSPGRYRLVASATNAAGTKSKTQRARFRIVKP